MSRDENVVFKALSDDRRRRILDLLRDQPRTTGDLCAHFSELNRCTVMQHLGVLEDAGLLIVRREGRHRWNYIDPTPIRDVHDRWIRPYAENAVSILNRMKADMNNRSS